MLCPELPKDDIAKILHIRREKLSHEGFKETFGFDFDIWKDTEPLKLYPSFSIFWGYLLQGKESSPF
jgi:hypothetical protein